MNDTRFFKDKARQQLAGKWLPAALVCFISWLLTSAFTSGSGASASYRYMWQLGRFVKVSSGFKDAASLISLLISGPINFGVAFFFLKIVRGGNALIEDMFVGFKHFINTFVLNLLYIIFVLLWMLLLIVPGIIAVLKYSMAYYIMNDNPEISGLDALRESKEMMDGHKMDLFVLSLSFIGWFILGLITFGIGLLWVVPYYTAAKINFYESIRYGTNERPRTDW